jgi:RsmE family RNA methyltransferase
MSAIMTVVLFIGLEGGLTAEEEHGVQVVTLGQRILRAETAALATVANVLMILNCYWLDTLRVSASEAKQSRL